MFAELHWNPKNPDKDGVEFANRTGLHVGTDHKAGGIEYITLADDKWIPSMGETSETLFT